MKMKKLVALVAAAAMVFAMAGCGSTSDSGDADATAGSAATEESAQAEVSETDSSAEAESTEDTSDGGTLIMATNAAFPPYESVENNEFVGIDVEIAEAIAADLGMELEITDIDFDSIIPSIMSGKADIGMAGMTVTDERLENVDFSDSYSTGVQVIIVTEDSAITSPDDLSSDILIGVQQGTTGHIYCADDYGDDAVIAYANGATAVEALKSGKVDCVVIDNEPAKAFVEANEGLKILETEYVTEDYAIAVAKGNDELLEKINTSLAKLKEDGTVQSIIDKYITAE